MNSLSVYSLDKFLFGITLPKGWLAVESGRSCNSGWTMICTWCLTRLFGAHLKAGEQTDLSTVQLYDGERGQVNEQMGV